jgi:glycosyltransferase involved in cell wall biosynthesis
VEMAKKVLEKRSGVKFVIAGTGDMMPKVVQLIAESGLSDKILLTGYLSGEPLNRALYHANLYVMPSVSEPFGISALEAVEFGTPVLMSKSSGAAEVIHNSLRSEFWDIEKMANQVIAILDFPVLGETLVRESQKETKFLTWKQQAKKIRDVYQSLIPDHA